MLGLWTEENVETTRNYMYRFGHQAYAFAWAVVSSHSGTALLFSGFNRFRSYDSSTTGRARVRPYVVETNGLPYCLPQTEVTITEADLNPAFVQVALLSKGDSFVSSKTACYSGLAPDTDTTPYHTHKQKMRT